jgi:hypothetical protein
MTPIVLPTNGYRGIGRRHNNGGFVRSQGKLSYVGVWTTRCRRSLNVGLAREEEYGLVKNRAEGNAPLTVQALAERLH